MSGTFRLCVRTGGHGDISSYRNRDRCRRVFDNDSNSRRNRRGFRGIQERQHLGSGDVTGRSGLGRIDVRHDDSVLDNARASDASTRNDPAMRGGAVARVFK